MKQLTTAQYAKLEGVTPVAIRKRIHDGMALPVGVVLTKHGRDHVFTLNEKYFKNKSNKIRK